MLKKSHITNIEVGTDLWLKHRLGRFTSSFIFNIMGEDGIGRGLSYIYQKVGEELTGCTNERELPFDEDIEWGKMYENEGIQAFGRKMGVNFLVTQKLISNPGERSASTPDAIWIHGECKLTDDEYNVSTAEGKCPRTYHKFIQYCLCRTPMDLYKVSKPYFWQTIDQMAQCGAAVGYFFAYHPLFPAGSNLNIITFRKMELWDQFKLLADRKKQANRLFEEIRQKMQGLMN